MRASRRSSVSNRAGHIRFACGRRGYRSHGLALAIVTILTAAMMMATGSAPASAQEVVAVVDGAPITSYDIDQRSRLIRLSTHKSETRKQVLQTLIDEHLKLREAKQYNIQATDAEVANAYTKMAAGMGMKPDQLTKQLASQGVNAATLKNRIRADISWGRLVRGRFQASLQISDTDIRNALAKQSAGKDETGTVGYIYTLQPILFIVPPGSSAAKLEDRRREAEAFRSRVSGCQQGVRLARSLRDVAVRDAIIRNSSDLPPPLRKMLASLDVGHLTAPEKTDQGIQMFAICQKTATEADTPLKQQVRQELFAKRFEAQSKKYLDRLRRQALIEYKTAVR